MRLYRVCMMCMSLDQTQSRARLICRWRARWTSSSRAGESGTRGGNCPQDKSTQSQGRTSCIHNIYTQIWENSMEITDMEQQWRKILKQFQNKDELLFYEAEICEWSEYSQINNTVYIKWILGLAKQIPP